MTLSLLQLSQALDLEFLGDASIEITGAASLDSAVAGDLCFIHQTKYLSALDSCRCSAVIAHADIAAEIDRKGVLVSDNPQHHFSLAINLLKSNNSSSEDGSIHPSAQISDGASLGKNVTIAALVVIEDKVVIGDGVHIGAASVIEKGVDIGANCYLHTRVTVGHSVSLGKRCELHSGVVIGSDGFGLTMHQQKWHKIPQLGSVRIEDDVEIGANTTIDRGALDDTVIEQGCKLDNQIQVAHNVRLGAHTAIAACVGIAGSAKIGRHCKISGAAVVLGHLSIADHVTVTAMSLVTKDIKKAGVYSSGTPLLENKLWHRNNVRYKSLDKIAQTMTKIEKKLGKL